MSLKYEGLKLEEELLSHMINEYESTSGVEASRYAKTLISNRIASCFKDGFFKSLNTKEEV